MVSAAAEFHQNALVIDSHNDSIVYHIRLGNRSFTGRDRAELAARDGTVRYLRGPQDPSAPPLQLTLETMRAGGIDCAFFAVDVTRAWRNHLAYFLDALGFFLSDLDGQNELVVARTAREIEAARTAGQRSALLVVENSDALDGSINILRTFYDLGVRSITLTHNPSSLAAAGNAEERSGGGLTHFGEQLVAEMNRLGMLVDVSHIAERGFWDVLERTERPVIASHSCCKALCDHPRNLSDAQLRALAENGGVVAITFVSPFLVEGWQPGDAEPPITRLIEHVDHAVQVAGIEAVGFGSDFDGGGTALATAAHYPCLTEALLARGYAETDIRKILGQNTLRVLSAALGG